MQDEDNFPITSVASSAVLKQWAKRLGYGDLHYSEINQRMTEIYQQTVANITTLLSSRKKQDVICLSFDKWTAIDSTKFIGGYLYFKAKKLCLGLMNYTGPCPAERIIEQQDRRLSIFNLSLSDIGVFVTDMGSDVQKVARVANKFTFLCLCHVVNLIVKDFMLKTGAEIPDDDELEFEADGADPEEADFTDVVIRVKREVRRVRHSIDIETRLTKAQEVKNGKGSALKLIQDNATRWNSTLDMLERFLNLRDFIAIAVDGIDDFNWDALTELVDLLSTFREITNFLQQEKASAQEAMDAIIFIRQLARQGKRLSSSTDKVFSKWVDNNPVVCGIVNSRGSFYDYVRQKYDEIQPATSGDHQYVPKKMSYAAFKKASKSDNDFNLFVALENFVPAAVDSARLFSWGRFSKNYLRNRMSPENHSRNVFINKNKSFHWFV